MRRTLSPTLIVLCTLACTTAGLRAQDLVATTEPLTPQEQQKKFRLPPGFEIQLVAAEPQIHKPMNIAFDARGRLWVTDTIEYPYAAPADQTPRDSVKVLGDIGPDGRAKSVITFADKLNIPLGVLPVEGGALVYAIPQIQRMLDTDGDGRADRREPLFGGAIGSKDTHGMTNHFTVGFDGWVYANHGFNNNSTLKASDGSEIQMHSGNTYRFRPDGSHVEYFAHGQVNPFGLCFSPLGDLFSADCHTRPQYMLLRGAFYDSFGKPHDGLGFGPGMMNHDHGSTAIAGTVYYDADHFPKAYRGTLFNGNPVTNRINHDRIEWHGSSPKAVQQPDFLACDDPWFRPVDIVLGPDGAMYVADFYNRIIGHYEVPLEHPGRDRERGRIWRIVYRGETGNAAAPDVPDLTKAAVNELVESLASPNLSVRMTAARQLVERVGKDAAAAVSAKVETSPPDQKVQCLWVLHRLGALRPEALLAAAPDPSPVVRTHVMRIVAERREATPELLRAAADGLRDQDPFVRRAAADALGRHPDPGNVRPLLDLRRQVPDDDTHLLHVVRMALRNQLDQTPVLAKLPGLKLSDDEYRLIADVAPAVSNPEVGGLIVGLIKRGLTDPGQTTQLLLRAARGMPAEEVDTLTQMVLERAPDDLEFQRTLYVALLEGLAQRGAGPGPVTRKWGAELARKLLQGETFDPAAWTFHPLPGSNDQTNPWTAQQRPLNGGAGASVLWSSHPLGERLTGVLRSRPFEIPATLSFRVAGHYGAPGTNNPSKNFVRLRLADGDEVIAEAAPPRDDTPHKVQWDLSKWAGKRGYLEAVDGETGDGFAWIAFGQFRPPVAPTPLAVGDALRDRQVAAATIARSLKLADLRADLEKIVDSPSADPQARAGAARALGVMSSSDTVRLLARVASDPNVAPVLRDAVSQSLGEQNTAEGREALLGAIAIAPDNLQRALATALAAGREGAEALLKAVGEGKASPRLLQDPALRERLGAAQIPDLEKRLAELTKGLPAQDAQVQQLMRDRIARFDPAKASAERGRQVFQKNCAACHQLDNVGALIGPQLAGIGKRGADRVVEDILDPNRNVDAAFRQTMVQRKNGDVTAGLLRREEGDLLVLADSTGKEVSVSKNDIRRRVESKLSIMPSNLGDVIPPEEFNDLLAYLLSK